MPYKERGGWRASVKRGEIRRQAWFPSRREALEWESEERKHLKNLRPKTSMGLLGLCEKYLDYMQRYSKSTYSHKKTLCRRILAAWGDIDVAAITPEMCLQYLDGRARISGNAANEDLQDLKAMFGHYRKFHGVTNSPLVEIEPYSHDVTPPYVPPREDILKLLLVTQGQDRVMLDMFRFTAARRSEVMRLTWDAVLFEQRIIRLKTHKSRKGKCKTYPVPMSEALYKSLRWQWEHRDKSSPYVFTNDGRPYARREDWLPRLCKAAKIRPFGYHSFRRAFASVLYATGRASLKDVSVLLGHSSVRNTELYLRSINPNLLELVEMLDEGPKYPTEIPQEV